MTKLIIEGGLPAAQRKKLAEAVAEVFDADMPLVLELSIVSEEEIRALNAENRGVDAVTDVLSFPASDYRAGERICAAGHADCVEPVMGMRKGEWVQKGARLYLGSVAVCKKRAAEQAEEYGHSFAREMGYLIVHGALHCLGYDHMTEEDKRVMRAREEEIMKKLDLGREA